MNVVSIMAHQDDEMWCLGTMIKCKARGDRLHFITLTDGSKGMVQSPELSREEAARIRDAEMTALADDLGATYRSLGEEDEFLYDTPDVRKALVEAIRDTGAELIFTHDEEDYNQDHVTTAKLVKHCAMLSGIATIRTDAPVLAEHPAVFNVEPLGPFDFVPTHYVDISAQYTEKCRLLGNHASQDEAIQRVLGRSLGELTSDASRFRGSQVCCGHAEAFVPMHARGAIKAFNVLP